MTQQNLCPLPLTYRKVRVTRYNIDNSTRRCPTACAVAEAVLRYIDKRTYCVKVDTLYICFYDRKTWAKGFSIFKFATPKAIQTFIRKYDAMQDVEPIDFGMLIPTDMLLKRYK